MGGLSHTVSGDIASFRTPSRVPIESLKFHFLPKQEGSGDPSPTNIRPITGWTGLNGRRAGKNIGHIVNFSANSGQIGETAPQLSNKYGTTLSTVTYSLPDTELVITQTSHDEPTDTSYKNGYFAVWIDNLEYDQRYDVSLKVKNVTDPLNVGLRRLRINGPSGGSSQFPTVVDNDTLIYKNVLHAPYINDGLTKNRKGWEFRLCGMSMTISEIMVTPANKSDGVFEPYYGSAFPVTFPVAGTNKIDPSTIVPETRISVSDGVYSNTGTDTRTFVQLSVQLWKTTGTYIKTVATLNNITTTGRKALTFDVDTEDCHYIAFKHNGIVADFRVLMPFTLGLGTYTLSVNLLSADPTTVGGFRFKDVQLEVGDTAHAYEPYSSDNTFYGGYIDPVAGEIVAEYRKHVYDGTTMRVSMNYKVSGRFYGIKAVSDCQFGSDGHVISNMLKTQTNHGENTCTQRPSNSGYLMDFALSTFCDLSTEAYDALTAQEQVDLVNDYLAELYENETPLVIVYKLSSQVHVPITAENMKAFLDRNNFWSDANDITEVTYAVTESKDMLATRKKAMDFDMGHHKKVKWNQIQIDGNFQNIRNWEGVSGYNTISISDGVMTCTCTTQPTQFYHTGFRTKNSIGFLQIPYNHKILVSAYLRCSVETRIRIYGLVSTTGNTYIYQYNQGNVNIPANTWTRFIGFIGDRPETPPSSANDVIIKRFKPCIVGKDSDMSTITVGTTFDCKNLMVFDLTDMFGLGNEPSTVEEFERICEINGIDLTTYQPYDTGSDRWLIIP